MKLTSTIKETGSNIINILEEDKIYDYNTLKINKYIFEERNILKANVHLQYCSDFCIIANELEMFDSVTDIIEVDGEMIHMAFLSEGNSNIIREMSVDYDPINMGELYRSYVKNPKTSFRMSANKKVKYIAIFIKKRYYLQLMEMESWAIGDPFFQIVKKGLFAPIGDQSIQVNDDILNTLSSIVRNSVHEKFKKSFIEIKLKELVLLYLNQYKNTANTHVKISLLDQRKLMQSRAYLTMNYVDPPTIKMLSKIISLNELKLKKGFKLLFGMPIHSYIIQLRMQKAEQLLRGTKLSINEVAFELGYKSVSHFILMFKSYFQITPKQFVDKNILRIVS